MGNFLDRFKPKPEQPAPIQNVASRVIKDMTDNREFSRLGKPEEVSEQRQWLLSEMKRLGLDANLGLEGNIMRNTYYAAVLKKSLETTVAGGNLAVKLGEVSDKLLKVMDPTKNLGQRAEMAFDICRDLTDKGRKNTVLGKLAKDYPVIFEPWIGLITDISKQRKTVLKNMKLLDGAVVNSENNLKEAGEIIARGATKITGAAATYDKNIGNDDKVREIQGNLARLGQEMVMKLSMGDQSVSEVAGRIAAEKKRLAEVPAMTIAANKALREVLEAMGTEMSDVMSMQALTSIARATTMQSQANKLAGVALPILAIIGLADALTTASWWSIYATYRVLEAMGSAQNLSMTPEDVKKAIEASNAESRDRYEKLKMFPAGPVVDATSVNTRKN